jgi:hypothetical protein
MTSRDYICTAIFFAIFALKVFNRKGRKGREEPQTLVRPDALICYPTRMPRMFLIDTDVASDDAVALIMALRAPDVGVVAITTVAGNVEVQQATRNALYTVELCGADVPVYVGAEKPLLRPHENATWFHGNDGLGEHGYPPARQAPAKTHAVEAIIEAIESHPGLVVVTLGPLTNLALAVLRKPSIADKVGRCVVMGGGPCTEGNVTPAAEYNIWVDPEAARIVLHSGLSRGTDRLAYFAGRGGAKPGRHYQDSGIREPDCSLRHRVQQPGAHRILRTDWRRRNLAAGSDRDVDRSGSDDRPKVERASCRC